MKQFADSGNCVLRDNALLRMHRPIAEILDELGLCEKGLADKGTKFGRMDQC